MRHDGLVVLGKVLVEAWNEYIPWKSLGDGQCEGFPATNGQSLVAPKGQWQNVHVSIVVSVHISKHVAQDGNQ